MTNSTTDGKIMTRWAKKLDEANKKYAYARRYYWDAHENELIEKIRQDGTFVREIEFEDNAGKIIIDVYRIDLDESDAFPDGSRDVLAFFKNETEVEFYLSGGVALFHSAQGGKHYNTKYNCWYTGEYHGPRNLTNHGVTCEENLREFFTAQR